MTYHSHIKLQIAMAILAKTSIQTPLSTKLAQKDDKIHYSISTTDAHKILSHHQKHPQTDPIATQSVDEL